MTASALFRTALTSAFILLMLASAHLFMVVINAAEMRFAAPRPESGQVARMFSDRPRTEELEAAIRKAKNPEKRHVLEAALAAEQSGKPVELRTLPVTKFLVWATLGLTAAGTILIWLTSRLKGDTAQTIVGIFGGNLIWTGGVEYGLTIAARSLGVGKAIGVVDGQAVAIYGEYVLLKHTWGFLALIAVYLLFLESSRCPVFLWWRKKVPTMRGPVVTGRIDNYGPRSGFQYATTVWGFYLLLLWAYDEQVFGVYSYVTKAIMLFSIAGSLYCARRLYQQTGWGPALRYAIAAMIVVWTPIEIAGKWGIFNEPWLLLRPEALFVFFGGLSFGTWTLWRAQRRRLLALAEASAAQASSAAVTVGPGGSMGGMGGMGGMSGSMGGMGGSMGSVGSMAAARVASAEASPARCPFSLGKPSDSMAMKEAPSRAVA